MYAKDFKNADKLQNTQRHKLGEVVAVYFARHLGFKYVPGEVCRGSTVS